MASFQARPAGQARSDVTYPCSRPVLVLIAGICAVMLHQLSTDPLQRFSASSLLLPFTLAAVACIAHVTARRARAQRALLEKQSSELRRAVDRSRRQEDLVTEVLDAVDFGVTRITSSGELAVTNVAHARLLDRDDASGQELPVFRGDGTTPIADRDTPLARARAGEIFEGELVWYGQPGEDRRALSVTARRLPAREGVDAGTVVVSRDVTVEEQARREREDFVASVSHELRTPLTSILGYLDIVLEDPALTTVTRERLEVAQRNASRLSELVADILALSTAPGEGFGVALEFEATDVSALVRAAIESILPGATEQGIRVDASGVDETTAVIDARRMRQVVDNLLANAVKYNSRGATVTVSVTGDDRSVLIVVSDDGPGISVGEQERLFDRFFRGDAVRKSSTHGSGLGLAISRDIVQAHGGEISVRAAPGEGAAFLVRLPLHRDDT
ncbi:sensor histidine kinase [Microbacterium trichothecenolyticum]|uniref:Sensor-like histidine kinase SenX3 n=1 Tax=Microbacterium trichothecenolyticum TaxID=69370 RepID=A0ABU0TTX8_MICTR|nr:HAMP domain-containing sensor histidine kinase [Microbacterium trichothecenolyticum]MDQ1122419.1 two-component system phosphate regulon sensor histidine kinase PhoR [Microbacterium trichothecenolyticum]